MQLVNGQILPSFIVFHYQTHGALRPQQPLLFVCFFFKQKKIFLRLIMDRRKWGWGWGVGGWVPSTPNRKKRIDFKLASLCFKSLNGSASTYLSDLLQLYTPRQFRSSADPRVFRIPSFRTKSSGQRTFSYQAPTTWNKLPASIRYESSVSSFKASLKTSLFENFFLSPPALRCLCMSRCVFVSVSVCLCVCV